MPKQEKCQVLAHEQLGPRYFKLTLFSEAISKNSHPGQFVSVRCRNGYDPLLRRPLSIHRVNQVNKTFQLLYEVVGKGTEILSQKVKGEELDILGPLSNGFDLLKVKDTAILIGGGMGTAPLLFLADKLKDKNIQVLIGASSKDRLVCVDEFKQITKNVHLSTDDGSCGKKCLVSNLLIELLNNLPTPYSLLPTIFACGPHPMLKAISKIATQNKIACQVSMEARMACGIGTCLGCVINTKAGYKKVCDEGPVFKAEEIIW